MRNKLLPAGIVFLSLLLLGYTLFNSSAQGTDSSVRELTEWTLDDGTGNASCVTLPLTLKGLAPRTPVSFTASVYPEAGSHIYLKTVYSPVRVYADGKLIFSYGQDGTLPAFLQDPPTRVELLPLEQNTRSVTLRLEFLSPSQRSSLTVYPVLLGTSDAILEKLFHSMGFTLLFSIVLIALGILLFLTSVILTRFDQAGIALFRLGFFSFLVGVWIFGECNLTGLFIDNPALLYLMAFLGLFTLAVPLLRFGCVILPSPGCQRILKCLSAVLELSVCAAVLLQLTGTTALSRSMYLFHLLIPSALCAFAGCIFREAFRRKERFAWQLLFPITLLAVFSILELANYYLPGRPAQISFFFQTGMLLFICSLCVLCGKFTLHSLQTQARNRQLSYELSLMEKLIQAQKERYDVLSRTDASIRAQRHDLKHQLTVIRSYHENGQREKLSEYLNLLIADIPVNRTVRLCENEAVNAVAAHYLAVAQTSGISSLSIRLDIPSDTGQVPESDLCVLIGNLLENAVAACQESSGEPPFIRMQSRLQYGILTITMDNRCRFARPTADGLFQSPKPGGGTGLVSIRSVAKRYGGDARFELNDHVFSSSVYLHICDSVPSGNDC